MNSPLDDYKELRNIDNVSDTAYFTLFEKYVKYNLKGEKKLIDIEDVDQESLIRKRNGGFPIPGMIYTFIYKGDELLIKEGNKDHIYSDLVPLVFCLGATKDSFVGLNLNSLPKEARLHFLQKYYETFKAFLDKQEALSQINKFSFNKRFLSFILSGTGKQLLTIFSRSTGENFKFAFRKYIFGKVKNLRMIEYPEWKYIPFYEPKDAFRKLNFDQIHKLYYKTK